MAEETNKTESVEKTEPSFTKKQVLNSRTYGLRFKDFFSAQLSDKKTYTHAELKGMIKKTFKIEL